MKKISAVMAAYAAAAIFTACGNSGNAETESASEITSAQETTEATATQEQETAQPAETVSVSAEEKGKYRLCLPKRESFPTVICNARKLFTMLMKTSI